MSYHSKSKVLLCRIRLYPIMIRKMIWFRSGLPLNPRNNRSKSFPGLLHTSVLTVISTLICLILFESFQYNSTKFLDFGLWCATSDVTFGVPCKTEHNFSPFILDRNISRHSSPEVYLGPQLFVKNKNPLDDDIAISSG